MKFKYFFYGLAITLFAFNCSSNSDDDSNSQPNPNPDPDPNPTEKVTYNADIKSIMTGNCISCHGNPTTQNAPFSLTTYTEVKNRVNTIISRINSSSNPMPPLPNSPLSNSDKNLIQQWKDGGLLEN